jgi:predicted  nucleic acid-binding Zn-ribbon protein
MTPPHDRRAARAEHELKDLEERSEELGEEIAEAKRELTRDGQGTSDDEAEGAVGDSPEDSDEPSSAAPPQGWA